MLRQRFWTLLVLLVGICGAGLPAVALAPSQTVRVGIAQGVAAAVLSVSHDSLLAAQAEDGKVTPLATVRRLEAWQVNALGGRQFSIINGQGQARGNGRGRLLLTPLTNPEYPPAEVYAQGRWYRGRLELLPAGNAMTIVNVVAMEQYLYGVVPGEMPADWPQEALKAQAVAARTYVVANLGGYNSQGFDICANTNCQMYEGAGVEQVSTNQAVDETRGQVLTYHGQVITAYYHSSAGGYTEEGNSAYLKAVPAYDEASPRYTWYQNIPFDSLQRTLAGAGISVGTLTAIEPLERSLTGRVKRVIVRGQNGSAEVKGETLRRMLGLFSTYFNVGADLTAKVFQFAGRGWGHGLGMSQWGARELATRGYDYARILGHYYPGTLLTGLQARTASN